jgi:hypothetical protein
MKRSLPVMLGIGVLVIVGLLVGGGFLSLPTSGGDDSIAEASVPEPAPRTDPEPIEVDVDDDAEPIDGEKKDRKRDRKRDGETKKRKRDQKKDARRDRSKTRNGGGAAARPRTAPRIKNRSGGDKQSGVTPRKPKKNGGDKPQQHADPAPVVVTDLRGDAEGEGDAPGYMDLEAVRLQASGDVFFVDLTFAGNVPAKLARGNVMVASIEVDRGDRKVSAYAEGTEDGWAAYTNRSAEAPASMRLAGRTMRFTIPRAFFGNEFSWYASTAINTDYFFDFAPDDGNGRFPSGGTT